LALLGTSGPDRTPETPKSSTPASTEIVSRRSLRDAGAQPARPRSAASASTAVAAQKPAAPSAKKRSKKVKGGVINVAVMTVLAGLIATMAIPAYAFNPQGADSAQFKASAADNMKKAQPQSVRVSQTVAEAAVSRDAASATSEQELNDRKAAAAAAAQAAAAEAARQKAAVALENYASSYTGPSAAQLAANPTYTNASHAQVFAVAQKYIGTPYVFGGSTPGGFDCSGYVMYVYSQFGISLPHSVSGQAALGTRIPVSEAQPGDVVIMNGHDGFYAGNGNIMDAPDVGRSISIRPIWTTDYYIVRFVN